MDVLNQILSLLGLIMPMLLGTGFLVKYLPFLRNVSNKTIPILNAIITFLTLFAVPEAQGGVFDSIGKALTIPAKITASILISYFTSKIYDKYLGDIMPQGPQPIGRTR